MSWQWYCLAVKHDAGQIDIYNFAPSADSAKRAVMDAERCPERAILKIEQKEPPKGEDDDDE